MGPDLTRSLAIAAPSVSFSTHPEEQLRGFRGRHLERLRVQAGDLRT